MGNNDQNQNKRGNFIVNIGSNYRTSSEGIWWRWRRWRKRRKRRRAICKNSKKQKQVYHIWDGSVIQRRILEFYVSTLIEMWGWMSSRNYLYCSGKKKKKKTLWVAVTEGEVGNEYSLYPSNCPLTNFIYTLLITVYFQQRGKAAPSKCNKMKFL